SPITTLIFLIGACLSSLSFLSLCPPTIFTLIIRLFLVAAVADITWGLFRVIDVVSKFLTELATKSTNNIDDLLVQFIRKTAKTILVLVAVFLCGETILELNITALMTTAGIAGLAIAFAAKDTIANFLSSIMIILDKPFKIGDRIRTGTFDGIVEAVGFRSSRIRGLDGNLFIIPNYQLADTAIENVTARPNIRYIFDLTLVYGTSPENMRLARKILERLTGDEKYFMQGENAPAIVFSDFKDWALNINVKVWFNTTDWVTSQEWRNNLNLAILEEFNRNGLDFAFPTNTTVIAGDPAMPLIVKKND
ncbi:MAG: mechanosensitive ion channel family protein, partial [Victivallaceae bacterium]